MHNLKPKTAYKIVTVRIAAPASLSDAEITDGINEMMNSTMDAFPAPDGNGVIADYCIEPRARPPGFDHDFPVKRTSKHAEEGELFVA